MNKQTIPAANETSSPARWKRELLFVSIGLGFGLFVLPLMIYFVGALVIGAYAGGDHGFGSFYGDLLRSVVRGELNGWVLLLGPYLLLLALRLIFFRPAAREAAPPAVPPRTGASKIRKEPTLSQ